MINEKRVKELFAKRNSSRVKIIDREYIYSEYLDEKIPQYVQYSGEVYVWNEEDLVYYNISRSECISLDFVLENVGMKERRSTMQIIRKNNMKFSDLKYGDVFICENEGLGIKMFDNTSHNNALSLNTYQTLDLDENLDVVRMRSKMIIE